MLEQLPALAKKGTTEDNLAKARKESFFDPNTGKYDTSLDSIKKMGEDQVPRTEALSTPQTRSHGSAAVGLGGAKTQAKFDLTQQSASPDSELSVAIGMAEGTRTAGGGKTTVCDGHTDPGNQKAIQGTFSYQHMASSPHEADQKQLQAMREFRPEYEAAYRKAGIDPGI